MKACSNNPRTQTFARYSRVVWRKHNRLPFSIPSVRASGTIPCDASTNNLKHQESRSNTRASMAGGFCDGVADEWGGRGCFHLSFFGAYWQAGREKWLSSRGIVSSTPGADKMKIGGFILLEWAYLCCQETIKPQYNILQRSFLLFLVPCISSHCSFHTSCTIKDLTVSLREGWQEESEDIYSHKVPC